ncbi:MAG: hypothetical protein Q7U75_16900, partial [Desulfobacterales bacterium]|nr:hypothetical protein [Desulfobacterales bacterium]
MLTLVQTERISVKVLALFPNQTEPEHWHPPVAGDPGKEETVRVISGTLYFFIPGENTCKEGFLVKGSTGGLTTLTLEQRCVALNDKRTEVASLNMGSV